MQTVEQAADYLNVLAALPLNKALWKIGYASYRMVAREWATVSGLDNLPGFRRFTQCAPCAAHRIEPRSTELWSRTAAAKSQPDPWAKSAKLFGLPE